MKTNGGVEVKLQPFLSSALDKSRRPPDIDDTSEYIEQTTMDGRQAVVIQSGGEAWGSLLAIKMQLIMKCYTEPRTWT
jgi:hypothetical protein